MRLPILVLHICAGLAGLLSGAAAVSFRKGSRRHRMAGNVFFISMLNMAIAATYLAFMKGQPDNVIGGVLTFYLVTTGWVTARRQEGETSIFDWGAFLFAVAVGVSIVTYGIKVVNGSLKGQVGVPVGMYFFLGSVALLAAAGDVRMLRRGGVFGAQRLARHLWRMCFGLFIATGSFFLGQQQVFPAFLRRTNVLTIPAILPLVLMVFWLLRVRFTKLDKAKSMPPTGEILQAPSS